MQVSTRVSTWQAWPMSPSPANSDTMALRGGSVHFNRSGSYRHMAVLVVVAGAAMGAAGCSDASNNLERVGVATAPLIWVEQQTLMSSDGAPDDVLGFSVSLSNNTALVGAPWDDDAGMDSGSAYVFVRSASTWTQQQKLLANNGAWHDRFGYAVSLSLDTALVGADDDDDNGYDSGSAFVFVRNGNVWAQQQKLLAGDGAAGDDFGASVAVDGATALIGASHDDDSGTDSGSAYVFVRNGNVWTQQQKLLASDGAAADLFGWAVSLSGDTALVGAMNDDDNGNVSGSAYVYVRNGSVWTQQQKLVASDATGDEVFGVSVSVDGNRALIGASVDDDNGEDSGSAYVFLRTGNVWAEQQKLLASDGATDDRFGFFVSLDADRALIGAHKDDDNGSNSGSAYLFVRTGNVWTEEQKVLPGNGAVGDNFGWSASLHGDTALVGSHMFGGPQPGAAFVFSAKHTAGEPCTTDSECLSGFCVDGVCCDSPCGGGKSTDCEACSVAAGAATDGVCAPVADDTSCDDGSLCTGPDSCLSGACIGSNPIQCTAMDECHHAGTCDPETGTCSQPTMPDGTAYGSDDWDDGGDMLYDIQASTGSSAITWIKLTDESALPATLSIATGANRPIGVGIFLVRGVDATLIEGWTNASSSDPSWAENTVLNSGAGTTSDDSLILSITASDGGDSAYQSESVSLTPGSWTEHDQFFVDWTVNCWGTFGSIAQATAGTLAKQDVFSVQTSDACCTIALPGTAVAADVFPPFRRRVNTLARM